ncbi:uncharacterized protein K02A2.6-like [Pecten maximus]|uniref:uncharacterized protein K02A2.6-like n=1 Tax=Pecten maximus TaxID=6579 RepID=UPI001458C806|nr:uncharacterized protein K02A2.6-like [Pecten maximus]
MGENKTYKRLKHHVWWHTMRLDAKLHVRSCTTCTRNKKTRKPRTSLGTFHAGFPMERVHVDILGPFTPSKAGNRYILMMVDQFTKSVELAALPNQSAETVAYSFVGQILSTFGCPLQVHTDQGSNFESQLFTELCQLLEITKTRTTPYHPSSNGQVERLNRTVLQMVRCCIQGQDDTWDYYLPMIKMAMHATENRSTGFTPNMLMLGREVFQPLDLMVGSPPPKAEMSHQWVRHLTESLSRIHELARQHLGRTQRRQKRDHDSKLTEHISGGRHSIQKGFIHQGREELQAQAAMARTISSRNMQTSSLQDQEPKRGQVLSPRSLKALRGGYVSHMATSPKTQPPTGGRVR